MTPTWSISVAFWVILVRRTKPSGEAFTKSCDDSSLKTSFVERQWQWWSAKLRNDPENLYLRVLFIKSSTREFLLWKLERIESIWNSKWIVRRAITCPGNCLPFGSSSQQIFVAKFVVKIVIFSYFFSLCRGIVCCLGSMDLHGVIFYWFHLLPFASDGSKAALGTLKRMLEGGVHPPWSPEQNSGWYGCVKLFI